MMADVNKTNDSDGDESEDKWRVPNDKMAEYAKSDEGGIYEARGQDGMQSSDKWSRRPSEEGCDNGSTESVAEYAQSDEGGTDEDGDQEDMQPSSDKCSPPSVEDCAIGGIQSDDPDGTLLQSCIHIGTTQWNILKRYVLPIMIVLVAGGIAYCVVRKRPQMTPLVLDLKKKLRKFRI